MFSLEIYEFFRNIHRWCFMKKAVLKKVGNIHGKVARLQLYYKETPTQKFSSEYCEIFLKNTYFEEHLLRAASDFLKQLQNSGEQLSVLTLFLCSDN